QRFDINGGGANTLALNASTVQRSSLAAGGGSHAIEILGGSDDLVNLSKAFSDGSTPGSWSTSGTTTVNGTLFNVYDYSSDATLKVLIDSAISAANITLL
ncbi:MAG: hypothetical protein VKK62_00150, partial [Synechococcaceae cyanobacterium]|nr:hypothetical protein [Synechococcaceae cyanobacterium]